MSSGNPRKQGEEIKKVRTEDKRNQRRWRGDEENKERRKGKEREDVEECEINDGGMEK